MLHWYSKVTIILRKETIIMRRREYLQQCNVKMSNKNIDYFTFKNNFKNL